MQDSDGMSDRKARLLGRLTEETRIVDSYESGGKTLREIGDEYGVSHTTIRNILRRHGVEMRERGPQSASYESGIISYIRLDESVSKRCADSKMSATEFWMRELTWEERSRLIALSCWRDGLFPSSEP